MSTAATLPHPAPVALRRHLPVLGVTLLLLRLGCVRSAQTVQQDLYQIWDAARTLPLVKTALRCLERKGVSGVLDLQAIFLVKWAEENEKKTARLNFFEKLVVVRTATRDVLLDGLTSCVVRQTQIVRLVRQTRPVCFVSWMVRVESVNERFVRTIFGFFFFFFN
jgi:hypothetical protein